jgi:FlaA1/EpsC-like NDP-sugar epimerase
VIADAVDLLGRDERLAPLPVVADRRIVVTGGDGYLGRRIVALLNALGARPVVFDAPADVLNREQLATIADPATWCLHLAAHKHAPAGEDLPGIVADLNVRGTQYVVDAFGDRVVVASTCKAADPMTVYGASKLIAERIALNAGGRVVRLVNVLGSSGSVLSLWSLYPAARPLPVTDNLRMWMTAREAAHLLVATLDFPTGRYVPAVDPPEPVALLAERAYPGRAIEWVPQRRGDRERERLIAEYEVAFPFGPGVVRVVHPADASAPAGAPYAPALLSV